MRKLTTLCAVAAVTLYVQGCALVDVQPETPRQTIAVTYGALEAAYNTVYRRFSDGLVTREEAIKLLTDINRADGYLDQARDAVVAGDGMAADTYLRLANSALAQIEKELKEKAGE